MFYFLLIVVALELISVLFVPATAKLFPYLFDSGYSFAKSLSLVVFAFISWYLISLKLIPFGRTGMILVILVGLIFTLFSTRLSFKPLNRRRLLYYLASDLIFILVFAFTSYLKFRTSAISGTEKPMDFAFVSGILRSTYFPPQDPWFAGGTINYYYFGHYLIAYLAKLLAIPNSIIFTFALPLIYALTAVNIYGIIVNFSSVGKHKNKFILAAMSIILVLFAGNLDLLVKSVSNLIYQGTQVINWWDPSRIIGRGFLKDSYITITEFPYFSLLLGDVHAHVIALLFGSLFISLCLCLSFQKPSEKINFFLLLLLISILLSVITMSNPWDLPGYLLLLFLIIIFPFILKRFRFDRHYLFFILIIPLFILGIAPFIIHFNMIRPMNDPKPPLMFIGDLALIGRRTLLGEYFNIWGVHLVILLSAVVILIVRKKFHLKEVVFPVILVLVGSFLVIFCEFFYINDFFLPPNERMNTVFKFYYQAWLILGIGVPLFFSFALSNLKPVPRKFYLAIAGVAVVAGLNYLIIATPIRLAETPDSLSDIDGLHFMSLLPDTLSDLKAINWFNTHDFGQENILESAIDPKGGNSYSRIGRISAATGLPTVIGWSALNHEGGWRNSSPDIRTRIDNVAALYNSRDLNQTRLLLQKYRLKYIYYGTLEKEAYPNADLTKFGLLGHLVYSDGSLIYQINR